MKKFLLRALLSLLVVTFLVSCVKKEEAAAGVEEKVAVEKAEVVVEEAAVETPEVKAEETTEIVAEEVVEEAPVEAKKLK